MKKGFTLIELLAVIIILAIVALIATPIILNVVEDARKSAGLSEANMIVSGINNYCATAEIKTELDGSVNICTDGVTLDEAKSMMNLGNANLLEVSYNGNKVTYLKVESNTHTYTLCNDGTFAVDDEQCKILTYQSHYINYGGLYNEDFEKVIETSDGNYIAIGSFDSSVVNSITNYNQNEVSTDALIVKYNSEGSIIWEKKFGGSSIDNFNDVIEVEENGQNYYVVSGSTSSTDNDINRPIDENNHSDNRLVLLKYDANGNIVNKKIFSDDYASIYNIIKINDGYIAVGDYSKYKDEGEIYSHSINKDLETLTYNYGLIMKLDEQFNVEWSNLFGGSNVDLFYDIVETDSNYIVVGESSSVDGDMADISKGNLAWINDAIVVSYDKDGNLVDKKAFGTSGNDRFKNIVKVEDGYITIGYSTETDIDLNGSSNAGAIVVKYDNALNYVSYKVLGNSNDDTARGIVVDNDKVVVVASLINENNYIDGMIVSLDKDLNILSSSKFDGGNSDIFRDIISTDEGYIISGGTFSNGDSIYDFIDPYSKGAKDAILVKYNKNLELDRSFTKNIDVSLIPKEVVKNYGTSIPSYENKETLELYTSNNPSEDIGNWCNQRRVLYGEKDNYKYVYCLQPFNSSDIIEMMERTNTNGVGFIQGLNDYKINKNLDKVDIDNCWFRLYLQYNPDLSNIKLIFNGERHTFEESVNLGYIEPLVIHGNNNDTAFSGINIVNDTATALSGGLLTVGTRGYPSYVYFYFKTKSSGFEGISLEISEEAGYTNHFMLAALRNFEISLSKAE